MTHRSATLPANTDDERFRDPPPAGAPAEWTAGDAVLAEVSQPIDQARHDPQFLVALVTNVLEAIGSVIGNLLSHWSH